MDLTVPAQGPASETRALMCWSFQLCVTLLFSQNSPASEPMLWVRMTTGVSPLSLYALSTRAVRFLKNGSSSSKKIDSQID
jgi:hypothetical protein